MEIIYYGDHVDEYVQNLRKCKQYRPTESTIIYRLDPSSGFLRFALLNSAKAVNEGMDSWGYHQDGIESDETLLESISRGLDEELGIDFESDITKIFCGYHFTKIKKAPDRAPRDGYSLGKAFIFNIAEYRPADKHKELNLKKDEVAEVVWHDYLGAVSMLSINGRKVKSIESIIALQQGVKKINEFAKEKNESLF